MDLQDNPFMNLLEIMRQQGSVNNPVPFMIGSVINSMPLLVKVGEIQLERDDLLINKSYLLEEEIGGYDYTEKTFKVGEKLTLLMSQDQQQFILICKVR